MSFIFLSVEQLLRLHQRLIETSGGSLGIRDRGVLESGLAANEEALDILLAVASGECTREEVEAFFETKTQLP